MSKKDINWINALKALCIIFVFLRHCGNYYGVHLGWFDCLYLPFYVNAFFFVSGYLLFWKQLSAPNINEPLPKYVNGEGKKLLTNIFFRIVVPSVIFATLEFFPKKFIKGEMIDKESLFFESVGGLTYWFTSALVVAELVILFLLFTRARNIWFYVIAAVCFTVLGKWGADSGVCIVDGHGSFPWQWKHGFISMAYMAAGGLYWRYEDAVSRLMKNWVVFLVLMVYVFISVRYFKYLYNGYMISMLLTHPVGMLWGIVSSILLIEVCRRLPENRLLTFIGQNSIGFYFLSGALPMTFGIFCMNFPIEPNTSILLAIWLISLTLAYGIVMMINRYAPWMWDLRKVKNKKWTFYD